MAGRARVKIVTIAVTYDPSVDSDPAQWDWASLADEWGNGPANIDADIRILTTGASRLLEAEYGEDIWEHPNTLIGKQGEVVAYVDRTQA